MIATILIMIAVVMVVAIEVVLWKAVYKTDTKKRSYIWWAVSIIYTSALGAMIWVLLEPKFVVIALMALLFRGATMLWSYQLSPWAKQTEW